MADAEHVASCKQRGAAAFSRGQHRQAAALFSEALRFCDEAAAGPSGAQLAARLYCNRALCLMRLQPPRLAAAAQDASAAIICDPCFAKGWYRRAAAIHALGGSTAAALADAQHALQLLREQGSNDTAQAEALVSELQAAAGRAPALAPSGEAGSTTACTNGHATQAEIVGAAAGLQRMSLAGEQLAITEAEGAGRCLVAGQKLPAGSEVLRERPFVHALTKFGRRSVSPAARALLVCFLFAACPLVRPSPCTLSAANVRPYPANLRPSLSVFVHVRHAPHAWRRSWTWLPLSTAVAAQWPPIAVPHAAMAMFSTCLAAPSAAAPGQCCCQ